MVIIFACDLLVDILVLWLSFSYFTEKFLSVFIYIYFVNFYVRMWWLVVMTPYCNSPPHCGKLYFGSGFFFFKGKKNCSLLLSTKTYSTNQESRLDKVLKLSVWPLLCFWVPPKVVSCLLYYCWCCYHNLTLGWLMKIFFNKKTISNKQVTSFVCMYGFLN